MTLPAPGPAQPKEPAVRRYVDEDYDFQLSPPPGWSRFDPAGLSVPGEICRGWTPDGTTTISVFIQKPDTAFHPRQLLDTSIAALKQRGAVIKEQEVRKVAGLQAMWLVAVGAGTGGALTGKGSVRTYQHWVAIPRERNVLVLLLTGPASAFPAADAAFKTVLDTLHAGGRQTAEQQRSEPTPLASAPVNLDFEAPPGDHSLPTGWDQPGVLPASGGEGYEVMTDGEVAHGGKASGRIRQVNADLHNFGSLTQAISAEAFRGKRVRLAGWLRTQEVRTGWAGLWMRIDREGEGSQPLHFDNMHERGVKGTTDWKRYEVVLDVPKEAGKIVFGCVLSDTGTLWADDLSLAAVGKEVATTH
ncbi:MAG: hypothetical protein WAM82_10735 [Thermoanaerobaculia bacterium]